MQRDRFTRPSRWCIGLGLTALVLLLPDFSPKVTGQNGPVEAYRGQIERISTPSTDPASELPPVPSPRSWSSTARGRARGSMPT